MQLEDLPVAGTPKEEPFKAPIMDIPPSGDHYTDSKNDTVADAIDHATREPRKPDNIIN